MQLKKSVNNTANPSFPKHQNSALEFRSARWHNANFAALIALAFIAGNVLARTLRAD